jgi:hypothetical protein
VIEIDPDLAAEAKRAAPSEYGFIFRRGGFFCTPNRVQFLLNQDIGATRASVNALDDGITGRRTTSNETGSAGR